MQFILLILMNDQQQAIIVCLNEALPLAEQLLNDIPEAIFSTKPKIAGETISINHPAFHLGHLSIYPRRIRQLFGDESEASVISDQDKAMFGKGAECLDDPERKIYPQKDALLKTFFEGHRGLIPLIEQAPPADFASTKMDPAWQARFRSVGGATTYLVGAHLFRHLGQLSAWRRCMGLPGVEK